jgi:hypothetical protein
MPRVRADAIEEFHERLEALKQSKVASVSLKRVVEKSMKKIKVAREHGATWDAIAQSFSGLFYEEGEDGMTSVSGKTIQGYYAEILREQQQGSTRIAGGSKQSKRSRKSDLLQVEEKQVEDGNQKSGDEVASINVSGGARSRFNFNTVRPS